MTTSDTRFATRASLADDLRRLGLAPADKVMVHAAVRRLGALLGDPDIVIAALADVVGFEGTVLAYANWNAEYEDLVDDDGRLPAALRAQVPPFDPCAARASRDHGVFAEFLRTWPGARRSGNPGASVVAVGRQADWFTADHPQDYGYGPGSPFAKLVEAGGKVLMLGAPLDTMSLLHHAEHLAVLPCKRVRRIEVPLQEAHGVVWRMIEEFDTADPVIDLFDADYFGAIVADFLAGGQGTAGMVAQAPSVLVEAAAITAFAVAWMEKSAAGAIERAQTAPGGAA